MKRTLPLLIGFALAAAGSLAETHGALAIKDARVVTVSGEELPKLPL